ncbi:MAG: LysR family transcriptional regulator [Lachnospiraceae bacterium]|nr:LysR family transcriptional regulator [Lachnospiraceae bacterium]
MSLRYAREELMNIDQLRYFKAVAEEENLGRASQRLHITQQGLSANIIKLESELGAYLFDRVGRQIYLNDTGRRFLTHVDRLLNELKDAEEEIKTKKVSRRNSITISSTGSGIASRIISGYLSCHNDTNIILNVIDDKYIPYALSQQNVDFVISSVMYSSATTDTCFLYEQPFWAAVSIDHPLAERSEVSLADLKEEKFALDPETVTFRKDLDSIFEKAGIAPNVVLTSNSLDALANCVQSGTAITIFGQHGKKENELWKSRNICLIPIVDEFAKRKIYMHWRKEIKRDVHLMDFLAYVRENSESLLENPLL